MNIEYSKNSLLFHGSSVVGVRVVIGITPWQFNTSNPGIKRKED